MDGGKGRAPLAVRAPASRALRVSLDGGALLLPCAGADPRHVVAAHPARGAHPRPEGVGRPLVAQRRLLDLLPDVHAEGGVHHASSLPCGSVAQAGQMGRVGATGEGLSRPPHRSPHCVRCLRHVPAGIHTWMLSVRHAAFYAALVVWHHGPQRTLSAGPLLARVRARARVCGGVRQINHLEMKFLELIDYDVSISSSLYASYYFQLRTLCQRENRAPPTAQTAATRALFAPASTRPTRTAATRPHLAHARALRCARLLLARADECRDRREA